MKRRSKCRLPPVASTSSSFTSRVLILVTFPSVLFAMRVCKLQCIDVLLLMAQLLFSRSILFSFCFFFIGERKRSFLAFSRAATKRGALKYISSELQFICSSAATLPPIKKKMIASVFCNVGVRQCRLSTVTRGSVKL